MPCQGSNVIPEIEFLWTIPEEGLYLCCRHCKFEMYFPITRIRHYNDDPAAGAHPGSFLKHTFETVALRRWLTIPHDLTT